MDIQNYILLFSESQQTRKNGFKTLDRCSESISSAFNKKWLIVQFYMATHQSLSCFTCCFLCSASRRISSLKGAALGTPGSFFGFLCLCFLPSFRSFLLCSRTYKKTVANFTTMDFFISLSSSYKDFNTHYIFLACKLIVIVICNTNEAAHLSMKIEERHTNLDRSIPYLCYFESAMDAKQNTNF